MKIRFCCIIKIIWAYIYCLDDNYKNYSFDILRKTVQRIILKNWLTIRKCLHIDQTLPYKAKDLIKKFRYEFITKRRYLEKGDDKLYLIGTWDEIEVFYEEPF